MSQFSKYLLLATVSLPIFMQSANAKDYYPSSYEELSDATWFKKPEHGDVIHVGSDYVATRDWGHLNMGITWEGHNHTFDGQGKYTALDFASAWNETQRLNDLTVKNGYDGSDSGGGAFSIAGSPILTNVKVYNSEAKEDGGAIYSSSAHPTFNDMIIDNNKAGLNGGAMYFYNGDTKIYNTQITNNQAGKEGGAIYFSSGSSLLIQDSVISNNFAQNNYGGIYSSGQVEISNTIFENNKTNGISGALSIRDTAVLNNVSFSGNSAGKGGAVYVDAMSRYTTYPEYLQKDGVMTLYNPEFQNNTASEAGGAIFNNYGTVNLIADGKDLIFSGNTAAGKPNDIHMATYYRNKEPYYWGTTNLNVSPGNKIVLNGGITSDDIGNIVNINLPGSDDPYATPPEGTVYGGDVDVNGEVDNVTVNLYDGKLTIGANGVFDNSLLAIHGGSLDIANGKIDRLKVSALKNVQSLALDVDLESQTGDHIEDAGFSEAELTRAAPGKVIVEKVHILKEGDGTDRYVEIMTPTAGSKVELISGLNKATGPIYNYDLAYKPESGELEFKLGAVDPVNPDYPDVNPGILDQQVGLQGLWIVQDNVYQQALRGIGQNQPRLTQAAGSDDKMQLWFRPFMIDENVYLSKGPRVDNKFFGGLIGIDSPLYYLGSGWNGGYGGYVAYTGSRQKYDGVKIRQNGAVIGVNGYFNYDNWDLGLTANAGYSRGDAKYDFSHDKFNAFITGAAAKAAYTYNLNSIWSLQPSLTTSYTYADTNDFRNDAGVKLKSDPLNAVQIVPGIKLAAQLKSGWRPYVGFNYYWNIIDNDKFRANNTVLPDVAVKPFAEYTLGVDKNWNSVNSYAQFSYRDGGREGGDVELGLRWEL